MKRGFARAASTLVSFIIIFFFTINTWRELVYGTSSVDLEPSSQPLLALHDLAPFLLVVFLLSCRYVRDSAECISASTFAFLFGNLNFTEALD